MKKFLMLLLLLMLCLMSLSGLADDAPADITVALTAADIQNPVQLSQWGDTAVCFAEAEGVKHLVVLERHDGVWQVVIDNPTALFQDADWPELLLDSDNAIFWTYLRSDKELVRYHSARNTDGIWGWVDQYHSDSGYGESTYDWSTSWDDANGGEIIRTYALVNENYDHGIHRMQIFPASWLADCVDLAHFDVSRFPTMLGESNDGFAYENERFFREAAATLMPEYTFIKGLMKNDTMHFLMEKPDGTRVYVICEYQSHREVRLIESTPLPEGTVLGYENFTDSLWIDGRCVTIHLLYNFNAGIEYIYDDSAYAEENGAILFFGDRTVWDGSDVILYGDHPWDDITQIDWNSLPHTLEEASAQMDSSIYAMVVNPKPADRLHLRERADKGSRSQGKYYTGTPVTVTAQDGDWTQVVFGDWRTWSHGYMMKRYLTLGQTGSPLRLDITAMPRLYSRENEMLKVYDEAQIGGYTYHFMEDLNTMKIIGIIGNDWYHVWFPATGEYGFVRQNDLMAGNG